jgi:hypothetical protein
MDFIFARNLNQPSKCYALPDNEKVIYEVEVDSSLNYLPTPKKIKISRKFKGEGAAYRASNHTLYVFDGEDKDDSQSKMYSIDLKTKKITKELDYVFSSSTEGAEFYYDSDKKKEILYVIAKEHKSLLYAFDADNKWKRLSKNKIKNSEGKRIDLSSLAINPLTGEGFAIDDYNKNNKKPKLYKLDLKTAKATFLTKLDEIADAEGLAFASDGNLYIEDEKYVNKNGEKVGRRIYRVDMRTGKLTPAAVLGGRGDIEALSCDGVRLSMDLRSLSGTIYNDKNADNSLKKPIENATVILYKDSNNNEKIDSSDAKVTETKTDDKGKYTFNVSTGKYFIVVDSKSLSDNSDIWAEQTYASKGGFCSNGRGETDILKKDGECFGGRRGNYDDNAQNLLTSEHITALTIDNDSVENIDFGFSFNVVTNNEDTGQGSLRQFIKNANEISGENRMKFRPSVAQNESSWWSIKLQNPLPKITDNGTIIDGSTLHDENRGSLDFSGKSVGLGDDAKEDSGDEFKLPPFDKPELEIDANNKYQEIDRKSYNKGVFVIDSSNTEIKNIALYNVTDKVSGFLIEDGSGNVIEKNFIGSRADGSNPNDKKLFYGIFQASDGATQITGNYISYIKFTGVWAGSNSYISSNVLYQASNMAYGDAITTEESNGDNIVIEKNWIEGAFAYGIESWNSPSEVTIRNNTLKANGQDLSEANSGENGGIRIYGQNNTVEFNIITEHPNAGIVIVGNKNGNKISKNAIYENGGLSIDIDQRESGNRNGDGVSANDGKLINGKANKEMDYPIFTVVQQVEDKLHLEGYIGTKENKIEGTHLIEVYKADDDENNNGEVEIGDGQSISHGEGKEYIGEFYSSSDGTFSADLNLGIESKNHVGFMGFFASTAIKITATATDSSNNTSEFGVLTSKIDPPLPVIIPNISIAGVKKHEGNSGTTDFTFKATLDSPAIKGTGFWFTVTDGSDGNESEYQGAVLEDNDMNGDSRWIDVPIGATSYDIVVKVNGDTKVEPDERFFVDIYSPNNGVILDENSRAEGIILNDDVPREVKPIAEYRFDECWNEDSVVNDSSINNYHGSVYKSAKTTLDAFINRSGKFSADGIVNASKNLDKIIGNSSDKFTVTAWIKPNSLSRSNVFIDSNNNFSLGVNPNGSLRLYLHTLHDDKRVNIGSSINTKSWNFIAMSYDNGSIKVKINDNNFIDTETWKDGGVLANSTHNITIGGNSLLSSYLEGNIDEVKFFDIGLTFEEIVEIYQNEKNSKNYDGSSREESISCLSPYTCDGTMYLSNANKVGIGRRTSNSNMYLHSIDISVNPFLFPVIGEKYNRTYNALAYNPTDNFLYANYGNKILKIGHDGEVDILGSIDGLSQGYSATFDKEGNYYLGDWRHWNKINVIDIKNKKIIKTLDFGVNIQHWDMTIDKSGKFLYMIDVNNGKFTKIDIENERVTTLGESYDDAKAKVSSIYCDVQNRVFIILNGGGFYEVDPNNGKRYFISHTPQLTGLNDGANCPDGLIGFTDFGDAPESYGVASAGIIQSLKLGIEVDHEKRSQFSSDASGDDKEDNHDDEDSIDISKLSVLTEANSIYSIKNIKVINKTGTIAYLYGWIDFNGNGVFDDKERAKRLIPTDSEKGVELTWQIPNDIKIGDTFIRVIISNNPDLKATGESYFGEVEDYPFEIKKANSFDAFDLDETISHRVIKTKEVNEDINITVVSIDKDTNASMKNYFKEVQAALFSEGVKLSSSIDVNLSTGIKNIRFPALQNAYKKVNVVVSYTDDFNITREINASDAFAIRPHSYEISITPNSNLVTGEDFNISISAIKNDGNIVTNYEENTTVYRVEHNETDTSGKCTTGVLKYTQVPFKNGVATFKASYHEIGKIVLKVDEVDGEEFASIDKYDGTNSKRFILGADVNSSEFTANKISLNWDFKDKLGSYTYYGNSPLDMGAELYTKVSVQDKNGTSLKNFTKECAYAKDVLVKVNYNENGGAETLTPIVDFNVTKISNEVINTTQIAYTMKKDNFVSGDSNTTFYINYPRARNIALEPSKFMIDDINTTILGTSISSVDSSDKNVTFVYGRAHIADIVGGKSINVPVDYEIYCKSCDRSKFTIINGKPESRDSVFWYIIPSDLYADFENVKLVYGGASAVKQSKSKIVVTSSKLPHKNILTYVPKNYLLYDRYSATVNKHKAKTSHLSNKSSWAGKGKTGFIVDENISTTNDSGSVDW